MSIVRFSQGIMGSVVSVQWGTAPSFVSQYGQNWKRFQVYKGVPPTNPDDIDTWNDRISDLLWEVTSTNNTNYRTLDNETVTVLSPTAAITQTGTATWMRIASTDATFSSNNVQGLVFTVSAPGGGGEVIFTNVNFVATELFSLQDIEVVMPLNYSF